MSRLKVNINEHTILNGEYLSLNEAQINPKITFHRFPNDYYTIIMVDPDAPSRSNPIYKYWLHLLIINNDQIIIPYHPPSPPKKSGKHRYIFYLVKQTHQINMKNLNLLNDNSHRSNFNLADFIIHNQMKIIESVYFETENP